MHYSGVLVVPAPGATEACLEEIASVAGVEARLRDDETGKIVAVVETESLDAHVEAVRQVQQLPHVALAEPVYHYIESEAAEEDSGTDEPVPHGGLS